MSSLSRTCDCRIVRAQNAHSRLTKARSLARSAAGGGARCDLIATCSVQHTTRNIQSATCNAQNAACNVQHATRSTQLYQAQVLAAAHGAVVLRVSSVRAAVATAAVPPLHRCLAVAADRPDECALSSVLRAAAALSFQWLPADVSVRADGTAKFLSYLNNLHPARHRALYETLEEVGPHVCRAVRR